LVNYSFVCVELPLLMFTVVVSLVPVGNYSSCVLNFINSVCVSSIYGIYCTTQSWVVVPRLFLLSVTTRTSAVTLQITSRHFKGRTWLWTLRCNPRHKFQYRISICVSNISLYKAVNNSNKIFFGTSFLSS
jgi:hypothetical protein